MKRQLAAILYADVAGYSRLTRANEEQTHQQLNAGLDLLIEKIDAHDGSKVHEAGDAILAEFASAIAAVEAAIEFQQTMAALEADSPDAERVRFRVGVNLGEVIRDRGDIFGDGVNIAARIQELATPGSVCVSGAVLEQLPTDGSFAYDDLGYRHFKNIERPIHVYQMKLSEPEFGYPMQEIESRVMGQPIFGESVEKPVITRGQCLCGSVQFEISQEPLGTGYCHCRICQRNSGAPVFAWTAFPIEAVRFTRNKLKYYQLSLIAQQGFCKRCGSPVVWRSMKPEPANYVAIATTCLENPEDYAPTWHGGTESQLPWMQIHDDLPRTRCPESPLLRKAWESVGVTDTDDWVALEYEQASNLDEENETR